MLLRIEPADDRPLYRQLAASVLRAVADGELAPGDPLPPSRAAAAALGVNAETVQRAYRLLADDGVVVSRVGRGTRIRDDVDVDHVGLHRAIADLVARATASGWSRDDLARHIRST